MPVDTNHESLALAVNTLLWAIDGDYFNDPSLKWSAYITTLRSAYEAETGKSGYPRGEQAIAKPVLQAAE